jgi:glycosyltransferase involved in cell wall biosynthesis
MEEIFVKKKVLIFAGYYLPSLKGGGPIQSIKNLVEKLSDQIDIEIIASDRDLGDKKPFRNLKKETWISVGKTSVMYTNIKKLNLFKLAKIINSSNCDIIYLNSFFSYNFSISVILLNKFKKIKAKNIILAPRGEFAAGALGLKSRKKKLYTILAKKLNLYRDVTWHATAETEKRDILNLFGNEINIKVASNLTANYSNLHYDKIIKKNKGELKIIFVSRIHPTKNLRKAIEFLSGLKGDNIILNIYGPIEDELYWVGCKKIIKHLSNNIRVSYKGIVHHDDIMQLFKEHHVLLLPTLGENYGHVISEALIGGCPVIISDQTPWKDLEKNNVGYDIPLNEEMIFKEKIQKFVDIDQKQYNFLSKSAFEYGKEVSNREEDINNTLQLFN